MFCQFRRFKLTIKFIESRTRFIKKIDNALETNCLLMYKNKKCDEKRVCNTLSFSFTPNIHVIL